MNKRNIDQAQVNAIERDILEKIKKGDLHSFKQLFENYYVMLCYIANGYLNSKQLSEEIVDDVFYKIWENRGTLNIHTSLKAYLIKAVRHKSINYLEQNRSSCYIRDTPTEEDGRENLFFADNNTPLSDLIGKEQEDAITLAINSLPAGCRKIFHLRYFENLKYEEIALKQNISVNTVKSQMQAALQKLRQLLSPYRPFLFLMLQDALWNIWQS
ncbi:ECF RNA polymerase sigma factor RpoE [termite gut metagenome]|uniref:ECF RNA polymerase sigma factor RpoE n=1 Tax=termite gut metagenome TaxID=433724 RepID=A0A5J4RJX5_9ZZZZ